MNEEDEEDYDEDSKPENSENQIDEEPMKKKRGRKPKSFYEDQQNQLDKQNKEDQNEMENEDEVLERQDEYMNHALFSILQKHSDDL